MSTKQLSSGYTFDCFDQLSNGYGRYTLDQKMNMIFVNPDFDEPNFVTFAYAYANIPERVFYTLREYFPPVFCRKYQMV